MTIEAFFHIIEHRKMNHIFIDNRPKKNIDGTYRCTECNIILSQPDYLCERCKEERHEKGMRVISSYWLIVFAVFAFTVAACIVIINS